MTIIRPATDADLSAIAEVFIETRTRCLPYLNWEYSQEVMEGVFAKQIAHTPFWVALADRQVVGFASATLDEIEHLYVLPEFHGQGIGKALLDQCLSNAGREVRLWAFQANHQARHFYEKHGFVAEFETDGQENMEKTPDARYVLRR